MIGLSDRYLKIMLILSISLIVLISMPAASAKTINVDGDTSDWVGIYAPTYGSSSMPGSWAKAGVAPNTASTTTKTDNFLNRPDMNDVIRSTQIKALNKESNSLELSIAKGDLRIIAGEVIKIKDGQLDIDGVFEVQQITFDWKNLNLSMSLVLDEIIIE